MDATSIELTNPDVYEDEEQAESYAPNRDDILDKAYDMYIGAELMLQKGDTVAAATVKRREPDSLGNATGKANTNPILDSRLYVVKFADGAEAEHSANVIVENVWAQCDADGTQHRLMEVIVDHKFGKDAVKCADGFVVVNGRKHMIKSTKGVQLCIQWKDGSTSWERLADVKESNPIEGAEYSFARGINDEPAFAWGWTTL